MALLIMGSTIISNAQTEPQSISIKGRINGIKRGTLHLLTKNKHEGIDTIASTEFKNSRFTMQSELSEPLVTQLVVEGYQGGFTLLAEPGGEYEAYLSNDDKAYIKGGRLNDAYTKHIKKSDSLKQSIQALQQRYDELRSNSKFRTASKVNDTLKLQQNILHTITREFLNNHDDLITAYTLYSNVTMRETGLQETKEIYESMGPGAKATRSARMIEQRIKLLEETANNAIAPDFTATDPDGNAITMSKVPGKIKIIDFWASWCGPCRLNNPALKKLYEEFKGKGLEIIGVSLDNKVEAWKNAIEKDGLTWINVSSLKGWQCDIAKRYNVKGVPSLFILDENNRIIASGLRGEKLKTFLQEKLK